MAQRATMMSLPASTATSDQRTTEPYAASWSACTLCASPISSAPALRAVGGRHQLAHHRASRPSPSSISPACRSRLAMAATSPRKSAAARSARCCSAAREARRCSVRGRSDDTACRASPHNARASIGLEAILAKAIRCVIVRRFRHHIDAPSADRGTPVGRHVRATRPLLPRRIGPARRPCRAAASRMRQIVDTAAETRRPPAGHRKTELRWRSPPSR